MRNKPYLAAFCMILLVAALGSGCGKQQTIPEEETGFAEQSGEQAAGEEAKKSAADEGPEQEAQSTEEEQAEEAQDAEQTEEMQDTAEDPEMWLTDEELPDNIPNSLVEEQAGKTAFSSYEELIGYLEKGQGYAYVTLEGYEGQALLVADQTYEFEGSMTAMAASVYLEQNGTVRFSSAVGGQGTAYPIRWENGIVYTAGGHEVCSYFISEETQAVMVKDSVMESIDDDGTASYIGFLREKNDFNHDEAIDTDSDEIFRDKMKEYDDAPVVSFTVAED